MGGLGGGGREMVGVTGSDRMEGDKRAIRAWDGEGDGRTREVELLWTRVNKKLH